MHDNMYKQKSADESGEQRRQLKIMLEKIDAAPRANIDQATWDSRKLESFVNKGRTGENSLMILLIQAMLLHIHM